MQGVLHALNNWSRCNKICLLKRCVSEKLLFRKHENIRSFLLRVRKKAFQWTIFSSLFCEREKSKPPVRVLKAWRQITHFSPSSSSSSLSTWSFSLKWFAIISSFCGSLSFTCCTSHKIHFHLFPLKPQHSFHFWVLWSSTHTTDKWLCLASSCLLALIIYELYFIISQPQFCFTSCRSLPQHFSFFGNFLT